MDIEINQRAIDLGIVPKNIPSKTKIETLVDQADDLFMEIMKIRRLIDISKLHEEDEEYQIYDTLKIAGDNAFESYTYLKNLINLFPSYIK
jgi:hypothetical protein